MMRIMLKTWKNYIYIYIFFFFLIYILNIYHYLILNKDIHLVKPIAPTTYHDISDEEVQHDGKLFVILNV